MSPLEIFSAAMSVAGSGTLIRTFAKDLLKADPCEYLTTNLLPVLLSETKIIIEEFRGLNKNQLFEAVETYLGTIVNPNTRRFKVGQNKNERKLSVTIDKSLTITDSFEGAKFTWCLHCQPVQPVYTHGKASKRDINSILKSEVRRYELTFHQSYKEVVLDSYLSYIMRRSEEIKEEDKAAKLHTVDYGRWNSTPINLGHPMTFSTLALDDDLKLMIMEDLNNFACGKDYYRKIGKAWKRGYLLFGPPGTGKSSLVAAMANYMNYDIFDLDLTEVGSNSDLKGLLLSMSNRCILVLEDIDCTISQINREKENSKSKEKEEASKVTLSGLLNFIDGLWSCCGEERIIVFTTNHKDKLDPALLRPGRMDMHIHMSYCTFSAFKQLALNCLEFVDHELFGQIEELIAKTEVTPAEVTGELMKNPDREVSIRGLVKFLENKIEEDEKKKCEASDKKNEKKEHEEEKINNGSEKEVDNGSEKEEEEINNASQKEEEKIDDVSQEKTDNTIQKEEEEIDNASKKEEKIDNTSQKEEEKIDNASQKEENIDNVSQKKEEKIDNVSQNEEEKFENASQNYQKEEDEEEKIDNASQKEENIDNVSKKKEEKIDNVSQNEEEKFENASQNYQKEEDEEEKIDNASQKEENIDNVSQKKEEKIDNVSQNEEEKFENASQNYQKEEDDGEIVEEKSKDGSEKKFKIDEEENSSKDVLGFVLVSFILVILALWGLFSGFAYCFGFLNFA